MVRNNRRKAFTIVELVIVIAVIAILAAVMIPTFTGIIKRANISADEQLAASINTQLSIYKAEGNKIETEADLINALKSDADFTAQLNPKSAKHGYHYWYDAAEQTVKLLSNDQVLTESADLRERVQAQVFAAGGDGVAEAAFNPLDFAKDAPRAVVAGFYLLDQIVDGEGNEISNFFAAIEGKTELGDDYLTAHKKLDEVTGDNEILANEIVKRMKATVVVSNSGVYYHADATNATYYFAGKVTSIKANQYVFSGETITNKNDAKLPTPANNQLVLPSTVISVEKDALKFATENSVTVVTSYANSDVLAAALAAGCSNAIFTTTDGNAYVVKNENELHVNGGEFKCYLKKRLPFSDFTIALSNDGGNLYKQIGDTVYVLITQVGENPAKLYAQDTASGATSNEIDSWTSDNENIFIGLDGTSIDFNVSGLEATKDYTATFTATAINDKLETVVKTINVEIVKATSASVKIDGKDFYLTNGGTQQITLKYDGKATYGVTLNGAYYTPSVNVGTNTMEITVPTDGMISVENNTLSLDTTKSDNTFTISVDDCLKTTFKVNVIDVSLAEFTDTFHKSTSVERPFYIGTGNSIKLSSFLKFKGADETFAGATVTIYDRKEGDNYYSIYEINNTENNLDATYTSVIETLDDWKNATVKFTFANRENEKRPATNEVYVEITGSNNYSIIVPIVLVENATNVTNEEFVNLSSITTNTILHGDVTNVPDLTKITISSNATLYGNGYIIDAQSYISKKAENEIHDYFIILNNGTVDNVYIDGPIYPLFVYDNNAKGYYVSGIKAEGNSTVKNSYIAGFRQPIALYSGVLNVTNSTLYGGTYANLQVIQGILNLKDVTTVQPVDGIADTFTPNVNEKAHVIGLGIAVEYDAVKGENYSTINIDGYLDQYNWVYENTNATLPNFTVDGAELDFKTILAAMFNGMEIKLTVLGKEVYSVKKRINFLDKYFYKNSTYLNSGIIFITLGGDAANAKANEGHLTVNDERSAEEALGGIKYKELTPQPLKLFSEFPLHDTLDFVTADKAMRLLENLTVNNEGKAVGSVPLSDLRHMANPIDVYFKVWSYTNTNESNGEFGPDKAVYTGGYYKDYRE